MAFWSHAPQISAIMLQIPKTIAWPRCTEPVDHPCSPGKTASPLITATPQQPQSKAQNMFAVASIRYKSHCQVWLMCGCHGTRDEATHYGVKHLSQASESSVS